MCSPVTCTKCGKTTWHGCGQHVDEVMSRIPKAQQCACDRAARNTTAKPGGMFASLFGTKGTR